MNTQEIITKQISSIHSTIALCIHIENLIIHKDIENIDTSQVDYCVQNLISKLYTIDAIHTTYSDAHFSHSDQHKVYLELIHDLIDRYEKILTLLKQKTKKIEKKLQWQDLFIRNIFKKSNIQTDTSLFVPLFESI